VLQVDGEPMPLLIDDDAVEALNAGKTATLRPCASEPVQLLLGSHRVDSIPGNITVEQVTMRNPAAVAATADRADHAAGAGQPEVAVQRTRTQRTITVAPCPTGCWLILGEGDSPGWAAAIDGDDLGPSTVVSGFAAWRLPPSERPTAVVVSWQPQRLVTVGLILSLLALIACIVFIIRDRTPAAVAQADPPRFGSLPDREPTTWLAATASAMVAVVGTAVCVALSAALWLVPIAVVVVAVRRPVLWRAVSLLTLIYVSLSMTRLFLGATQVSGFDWPLQFERWHRATVTAVIVLFAGAISWARTVEPSEAPVPADDRPLPSAS
jgi:arabinofuranan 3-O-arabinosyltransferase